MTSVLSSLLSQAVPEPITELVVETQIEPEPTPVATPKKLKKKSKQIPLSLPKRHKKEKPKLTACSIIGHKGVRKLMRQCSVKSYNKQNVTEAVGIICLALLAESIQKSAYIAQFRSKSLNSFLISRGDCEFVIKNRVYSDRGTFYRKPSKEVVNKKKFKVQEHVPEPLVVETPVV